MSEMSEVIAITGTMGSGKSEVRRILSDFIPTTDCDMLNARLLEPDQAGTRALKKAGLYPETEDGQLDRMALSKMMFDHPEIKKQVEGILHPLILEAMDQWIEKQRGLCAVEVPLLFEANLQDHFNLIWCVMTDPQIALERLETGRHIPREEAQRRLDHQWSPEQKAALSDIIIRNDATKEELHQRVNAALDQSAKIVLKKQSA